MTATESMVQSATTAFEQDVTPHLPSLYRTALRMTRQEQAAEDLVQDTLERAYKSYHRFEQGTNFHAWLFKILTYVSISNYRRQTARAQTTTLEGTEEFNLYRQMQGAGVDPAEVEGRVLDQLGQEVIKDAIEELAPEFRLVVMLVDAEGFSYKESAEILSIPLGTVMSRLHRGRRLLQRALWDYACTSGIVRPEAKQ